MTREEKIAELINIRDNFNYTLAPKEVFDDAIKALEQEPRKGEWIRVVGGNFIDDYRCSNCSHKPSQKKVGITWGWDFTDYCPNCGADMRGEE